MRATKPSGQFSEGVSYRADSNNTSYVYMDTFCFHPIEFIPIVKSERSVYMNAK